MLLDLLEGIGPGLLLAHHEQRHGGIGELLEHRGEGRFQADLEIERAGRDDLLDMLHQRHAADDAHRPALQRGDGILRLDRRAVVEDHSGAQREAPDHAIVALRPALDHLRPRPQRGIEREEHVVDHVAMAGGLGRGGPYRIEDLEIGLRHEAQDGLGRGGLRPRDEEAENRKSGAQRHEFPPESLSKPRG